MRVEMRALVAVWLALTLVLAYNLVHAEAKLTPQMVRISPNESVKCTDPEGCTVFNAEAMRMLEEALARRCGTEI